MINSLTISNFSPSRGCDYLIANISNSSNPSLGRIFIYANSWKVIQAYQNENEEISKFEQLIDKLFAIKYFNEKLINFEAKRNLIDSKIVANEIIEYGTCLVTYDLKTNFKANIIVNCFDKTIQFDLFEAGDLAYNVSTDIVLPDNTVVVNPELEFNEVVDVEGNIYKTIIIGNQEWMAENLRTTTYADGSPIINAQEREEWLLPDGSYKNNFAATLVRESVSDENWRKLSEGAYCNYDNLEENALIYGRLYNWFAANNQKKISPKGWVLPSLYDWIELDNFLKKDFSRHDKVKLLSNRWKSLKDAGTNESGFSTLPAGSRSGLGDFHGLGTATYFWASDLEGNDGTIAWNMHLYNTSTFMHRNCYDVRNGYSIRCMRKIG
jgi:uncharacterized protein (TIGR02145 family)